MTLTNVCMLFDSYTVVEKQSQVSNTFFASSEHIFSDGVYHSHIEKHGYIQITDVENATYIMFVDQSGNIFLNIYKYTQETKYKEIIDNLNTLRELTGIHHHTYATEDDYLDEEDSDAEKEDVDLPSALRSKYIDLNTFVCLDCSTKIRYRKLQNTDAVIGVCTKCNTEYTLVPSKYYVLKAKKITYKNTTGSRRVKFE